MTKQKTPFMVSALLVFGAWLSSLIFVGFLAVSTRPIWLETGLFLIAAAAVLQWLGHKKLTSLWAEFMLQVCVPFALSGKCLLAFYFIDVLKWPPVWADCLFIGVLAALSYPFFTQRADRFISVCAAGVAAVVCLNEYTGVPWVLQLSAVLLFALAYGLFLRRKESLQPLAWGLLFAAPACLFYYYGASFWYLKLALAAVLCAAYVLMARSKKHILVCLLIVALVSVTNIGAGAALGLLALGQSQKRLSLTIIGAGVLAVSLFWLYYSMEISLLAKSGYLCGAGLILLGVYAALKKGETYAG